jgi:UDP-glucose 4-epimerase
VVLLDNFSNSNKNVLKRLKEITGKTVSFVKCDVCNTKRLAKVLKDFNIDSVVHLAGLKAVDESISNPLNYFINNIQGSISLLKAMELNNVKKLVFSSSATIYGVPSYLPIDENHPENPINPYGRSKFFVEKMLEDLAASDGAWSIVSLRYFNPVGADDSGILGELSRGTPKNLMPIIAQVAIGNESEISIFGSDYPTPDGTGVRDYIHILDLAEGHLAAINYVEKTHGYTPINLGTGKGTSVMELIESFSNISEKKIAYKFHPKRNGDVPSCYAATDKAKKILNWQSKRTLDQMCLSAWQWQCYLKND